MSTEVLSQDEVDALLTGVAGADEIVAPPPPPIEAVRRFDPAMQERVVRAPMERSDGR